MVTRPKQGCHEIPLLDALRRSIGSQCAFCTDAMNMVELHAWRGGAHNGQKVSLAGVHGTEPNHLLHWHEDECTHTHKVLVPVVCECKGTASITSVNVTSLRCDTDVTLRQQGEAVVAHYSDIICLTEVRMDNWGAAGYTVLWGASPPMRVKRRGFPYLAWGGAAIAVKNHWSIPDIPLKAQIYECNANK
eukprot:6473740-Amphidinium_carterae.1